MNKTVVLSICALLLVGVIFTAVNMKSAYRIIPVNVNEKVTSSPFVDWREFIPLSKRFKVMLPAVPQYAKETVDIPNTDKKRYYEMFISEKASGAIFMISQITYPADYDTKNARQLLQAVVDEMVKTDPNNQLNYANDATFLTYPAIDFNITNKDFGVDGKAFMTEKTVYLLTHIAKNSESGQEDKPFFQS